jgi:sulfate transport system ATP-binding protein
MGHGRIEQVGTPSEVYDSPATAFVHDFIGESVALPISVENGVARVAGRPISIDAKGIPTGAARLFVRPHDLELADAGASAIEGQVLAVRRFGPTHRIDISVPVDGGRTTVEAAVPAGRDPKIGQTVGLIPERYRVFAV